MSVAPYISIDKPTPRPKKPRQPLKRTAFKARFSKRARARMHAWNEAKKQAFTESDGQCVVKSPVCSGRAEHAHHRQLRSRGGKDVAANAVASCACCHAWIHQRPAWAAAHGFMTSTLAEKR